MPPLNQFELQAKVERILGLQPEDIYCDDFAGDISLEERTTRRVKRDLSISFSGKPIGYDIDNGETHEIRFIHTNNHKIMYDKNCKGCVLYNKETGEQRIISQKEFEQAYYKWRTN